MVNAKTDETTKIDKIAVEKAPVGLGGWLGFCVVWLGAGVVSWIWAFFLAIMALVAGVSGTGLGVAIETLIFALVLVGLYGLTLFMMVNRRKIAALFAYISLGATALYTTIVSFTTMFSTYQSCSYGSGGSYYSSFRRTCESVGLPAEVIVLLIGAIFVAWASVLLGAYYFKKSERVRLTLTK